MTQPQTSTSTSEYKSDSSSEASTSPKTLPANVLESYRCPECNGAITDEGGETYCTDCGLVVTEQNLSRKPPRRTESEKERKHSGPGSPRGLSPDLSTEIAWVDPSTFNSYSEDRQRQFTRLRTVDKQTRGPNSSTELQSFGQQEVTRISGALGLSQSTENQAINLFTQAYEKNIAVGRTIEGVAGASILGAIRENNEPIMTHELSPISKVDRSTILQTFRVLQQELQLKVLPPEPGVYIPRFCTELDLSQTVSQATIELLSKLEGTEVIVGKSPPATAASLIYTVSKVDPSVPSEADITQAEVATVANTDQKTISSQWQEIQAYLSAHPEIKFG